MKDKDHDRLEIHIKYGGEWLLAVGTDGVKDGFLDTAIGRMTDTIIEELRKVMQGKEYDGKTATFDKDGVIDTDPR